MKKSRTDTHDRRSATGDPPFVAKKCGSRNTESGNTNRGFLSLRSKSYFVRWFTGRQIYEYSDPDVLKVFGKSREFRKASFKAILDTLTYQQKQQIVDHLKALNAQAVVHKEFGYSTNGYYHLMKAAHDEMTQKHQALCIAAEALKAEMTAISAAVNQQALTSLQDIIAYARKRSCQHLQIGYETNCQTCHFALNEIVVSNQTVHLKTQELETLRQHIQVVRETPDDKPSTPQQKRISFTLQPQYQVADYRKFLQSKLAEVSGLQETDIVVVEEVD